MMRVGLYSLASGRQWGLLSGDGELRALAQAEQIPLYGVLWVTDQMFEARVVEAAVMVKGLEAIAAHPRCLSVPKTCCDDDFGFCR